MKWFLVTYKPTSKPVQIINDVALQEWKDDHGEEPPVTDYSISEMEDSFLLWGISLHVRKGNNICFQLERGDAK